MEPQQHARRGEEGEASGSWDEGVSGCVQWEMRVCGWFGG